MLPQDVLNCLGFFLGGEDNKIVVLWDSALQALNSLNQCAPCNLFFTMQHLRLKLQTIYLDAFVLLAYRQAPAPEPNVLVQIHTPHPRTLHQPYTVPSFPYLPAPFIIPLLFKKHCS